MTESSVQPAALESTTTDDSFPAAPPPVSPVSGRIIDWVLRVVKGVFIGTGFILPGVSGGALAAVFGLYERLIEFLAHLTHQFRRNLLFFLPVGLGAVVSVVLFSAVLSFLFDMFLTEVLWFFAGCIIGILPALWRQSGKRGRKPYHYAILAVAAVIGYTFMFLAKDLVVDVPVNFVTWVLAGALIALGFLVPGLSPSNFLLYFGLYDQMTDGFKSLDLAVIVPLALGGLACVLALSKFVAWLLKRVYTGLFHAILGIVIASTVMILPIPLNYDYLGLADAHFNYTLVSTLSCILIALMGAALGWWMSRLEDKYVPDETL